MHLTRLVACVLGSISSKNLLQRAAHLGGVTLLTALVALGCIAKPTFLDADGDGETPPADCNNDDPAVNHARDEDPSNGVDDNCDGQIDESTPTNDKDHDQYSVSAGDCNDNDASVNPGLDEDPSNGVDDNCNGEIDEPTPTNDWDHDGTSAKAGDCNDQAPSIHPGAEENPSNGIDDNCDGNIDEPTPTNDWDGDGYTALEGDCQDQDEKVHPGAPELCNGKDDDCDSVEDDGNPESGGACILSGISGKCNEGILNCVGGTLICTQVVFPDPVEQCNGVDDDCDGIVDQGNPDGGGACQVAGQVPNTKCAQGVLVCSGGVLTCPLANPPTAELCNGDDDDCDGTADDGDPEGGLPCAVPGTAGPCLNGTSHCLNHMISCTQNIFPTSEDCNNIDDDCDGVIDNGNPGAGALCNVSGQLGICATGATNCQSGALTCSQTVQPKAESCNNEDDDCNGIVDDLPDEQVFIIPFNVPCGGVTQTKFAATSISCATSSYVAIPVLTRYPDTVNDATFSIVPNVPVPGTPYVQVTCADAPNGSVAGYAVVLAKPKAGVGEIEVSNFQHGPLSGFCDPESSEFYPSVSNSYSHRLRMPAITDLVLKPGGHNPDTTWYVGTDTQAPFFLTGDDQGGSAIAGRLYHFGFADSRVAEDTHCFDSSTSGQLLVNKPLWSAGTNIKYVPLMSVYSFRDDVTCDGAFVCVDNLDDTHGFDVDVQDADDSQKSQVRFVVNHLSQETTGSVGLWAGVIAYP